MSRDLSFSSNDTVAVYGDQRVAIQAMLDYDFVCSKEKPSVQCIIGPRLSDGGKHIYFWGKDELLIPTFASLEAAFAQFQCSVLVNVASSRSAFEVTKEALENTPVKKIIIIAEGMPERQARILKAIATKTNKLVIGPATVGVLIAGVLKAGSAGGTIDNIVALKLFVRGSVGIVSKSGGMLNELMTIVTRVSNGVCEAIAIGGDRFPATTLSEQALRFEENDQVKLILLLGEVGGTQEQVIAELIQSKRITKPVVAWVSGMGATSLRQNIQFGHAGAMANTDQETAAAKIKILQQAGAIVPNSYAQLEETLHNEAKKMHIDTMTDQQEPNPLPTDFNELLRKGQVRYPKQIHSSISPKMGQDESYFGQDIATVAEQKSLGYIIGLLWFKKEFSPEVADLFELMLKVTADHGPAVSGAHNTIVAARAGKDLVSSLVSGLLTIGPRFGGAVNAAAFYFKGAVDNHHSAYEFVEQMKKDNVLIPGIGHKVKSKTNPDKRVALLVKSAQSALEHHSHLTYALQVEAVTSLKKDSLILNVDGAIAAILLDILGQTFNSTEIDDLIKMEALNAFFVLGRSIGLIGHYIDQKRLDQPLYRHPEWDILELE